jgi:hypothetical protein
VKSAILFRPRLTAPALGGAVLLAAFGAATEPFTLGAMAGPGNAQAIEAAVDCRFGNALRLARREARVETLTYHLFSRYVQSAVYIEFGEPARAAAMVDEATADSRMNPDGASSRRDMQNAADAIVEAIREQRAEDRVNRLCPT